MTEQNILERNEVSEGIGGKYVDLTIFQMAVECEEGCALPTWLSKDQRVIHTAIVDKQTARPALESSKGSRISSKHEDHEQREKSGYKKDTATTLWTGFER